MPRDSHRFLFHHISPRFTIHQNVLQKERIYRTTAYFICLDWTVKQFIECATTWIRLDFPYLYHVSIMFIYESHFANDSLPKNALQPIHEDSTMTMAEYLGDVRHRFANISFVFYSVEYGNPPKVNR